MINKLKTIFGHKCSAIKVNGTASEFFNVPPKKLKFCEAVSYSFDVPVRLINENLGCPGARRSVGFDMNDQQLTHIISENNHISSPFISDALSEMPALENIKHINLGVTAFIDDESGPDLFILYVTPDKVTFVMHALAKHNIVPSLLPYSLLSVCGNVFANCYINQKLSISFGCPESRKYGGIGENEVVMGFPYALAKQIISDVGLKA
jgi:uncharacterized protein (DUF169 family)